MLAALLCVQSVVTGRLCELDAKSLQPECVRRRMLQSATKESAPLLLEGLVCDPEAEALLQKMAVDSFELEQVSSVNGS